jgi:hypothetical protein
MRRLLLTAALATLVTATLAAQAGQTMTISGCLKPENDVPGLKPDSLERLGTNLDFILTNVKMAQGSNVSGIALESNYEIEGVNWAELLKHINHQIEVTGSVGDKGNDEKTDATDFKATSFKMLSMSCEQK